MLMMQNTYRNPKSRQRLLKLMSMSARKVFQVGVVHGVIAAAGGAIVGIHPACLPTVYCVKRPEPGRSQAAANRARVDYSGGNTNSVAKWCCWLLVACRRSGGRWCSEWQETGKSASRFVQNRKLGRGAAPFATQPRLGALCGSLWVGLHQVPSSTFQLACAESRRR
jgi:hypothetical protein